MTRSMLAPNSSDLYISNNFATLQIQVDDVSFELNVNEAESC